MHKKRLKVSVCIVTYNHGRYIDDCLASVVGQQMDADLEVLVGDDCSMDHTRAIISSYANRYPDVIRPVFHEKNIGGSHNYLSLIGQASGDYIAHLDGDDFWLPGKLAAQISFLGQNQNCVAVYTNAIVINNAGELLARFNGVLPQQFDLNYLVREGNFLNASSVMYRSCCKTPILQLEGEALDYHYNILLAGQGRLGYINRDLVAYRRNSTTSIIVANVEFVRELFWKTILCAGELGVDNRDLQQCTSRFYNNICLVSIAGKKWNRIWFWGKKILSESTFMTRKVLLKTIMLLPFEIYKIILRKLARILFKGGAEILYDR